MRTILTSFVIGDDVENLAYVGPTTFTLIRDFAGTGNALDNTITGGHGNDTVDGGAGADTLIGGLGDDSYLVDMAGDAITELAGGGIDRVTTALGAWQLTGFVEELMLTTVVDSVGTGNDGDNWLGATSAAGSVATLIGGGGTDTLDGTLADGRVNFRLEFANAVADGPDLIVGFSVTGTSDDDRLQIAAADFGNLAAIEVVNRETGNAAEAFGGEVAQFIYEQDVMTLWFDDDGIGANSAVMVATFDAGNFGNDFSTSDFVLI